MSNICTRLDDFILDKDKPYWIATLSDGTKVYEDDGRAGIGRISWERLKDYCYSHKISVDNVAIQFRSHYEFVMNFEFGAFFRRMALGQFGTEKTQLYYIFGSVNDRGEICTTKWMVPELIESKDLADIRNIAGHENEIIWNLNHPQLESMLALHNISLS